MLLENAITGAAQISDFIMSHRKVLHDFHFENVHLRSGGWDSLTRISAETSNLERKAQLGNGTARMKADQHLNNTCSACDTHDTHNARRRERTGVRYVKIVITSA
jgi:hypothetical protein